MYEFVNNWNRNEWEDKIGAQKANTHLDAKFNVIYKLIYKFLGDLF
jgi:hypothetical protein